MANVLLGVTGSVAAIRTPQLYHVLTVAGHVVRVVATASSLYFFNQSELPDDVLVEDADEWPGRAEGEHYKRDDPVLHVELRKWADVLLIAPLDANTLAKLASGLCDNCLTCVYRAWDPARPVLVAPAMNTFMWLHPLTRRQLQQLGQDYGAGAPPRTADEDQLVEWINKGSANFRVIAPISKRLACGDVGVGGMADVEVIAQAAQELLSATARHKPSP